jgi:hypothetical protein
MNQKKSNVYGNKTTTNGSGSGPIWYPKTTPKHQPLPPFPPPMGGMGKVSNGEAQKKSSRILPRLDAAKSNRTPTSALSKFEYALGNFPAAGMGNHSHVLTCANHGVWAGLSDEEIAERIAAAMNRPDQPGEIQNAIDKVRAEKASGVVTPQLSAAEKAKREKAKQEKAMIPEIALSAVRSTVKNAGGPISLGQLSRESPVILGPLDDPAIQRCNAALLLNRLHPEDAVLFCGEFNGGKDCLDERFSWECEFEDLQGQPVPPFWIPNALTGRKVDIDNEKSSYRCDAAVADHRYVLFEIDDKRISLQEQAAFLRAQIASGWPVRSIVYSGSKSLHALLEVNCGDAETWELEVKQKLKPQLVALGADPNCFHPSRLSRLPGHVRDNGNLQSLVWLAGGG